MRRAALEALGRRRRRRHCHAGTSRRGRRFVVRRGTAQPRQRVGEPGKFAAHPAAVIQQPAGNGSGRPGLGQARIHGCRARPVETRFLRFQHHTRSVHRSAGTPGDCRGRGPHDFACCQCAASRSRNTRNSHSSSNSDPGASNRVPVVWHRCFAHCRHPPHQAVPRYCSCWAPLGPTKLCQHCASRGRPRAA